MTSTLKQYAQIFNAQTLRERGLIAFSLIVAASFLWWSYYAQPKTAQITVKQNENQRIGNEVESTRAIVRDIRQRIAAGVNQGKEGQLAKLREELITVEDRLRVKTVELIDPEKMFQLMNELVYRDSRLKLLSLRRREVKPAIPEAEDPGQQPESSREPSIYRHVLEIEFAGKFLDILKYMQSLEALDWKLLWDEINIISQEYPTVTVKVVISTLSARKEWVGI